MAAEAALVAAVVDQVASGRIERRLAGRGMVAGGAPRGRVEAPYLQLVMERLWEVGAGAGSLTSARRDARGARGSRADRPAAPRAGTWNARRTRPGPRRTAVPPARDSLGNEDRPWGRRSQPVRRRTARAARGRAPRALGPTGRPRRSGENGGGPRYEIYHDVLAGAVLDWGARHEADRALASEREAARRRHRRMAAIVVLRAVALAVDGAPDRVCVFAAKRGAAAGHWRVSRSVGRAERGEGRDSARAATSEERAEGPAKVKARRSEQPRANERTRATERGPGDETERADSETKTEPNESGGPYFLRRPLGSRPARAEVAKAAAMSLENAEITQRQKTPAIQRRRAALQAAGDCLPRPGPSERARRKATSRLGHRPGAEPPTRPAAARRLHRLPGSRTRLRDALINSRARAVLPSGSGSGHSQSRRARAELPVLRRLSAGDRSVRRGHDARARRRSGGRGAGLRAPRTSVPARATAARRAASGRRLHARRQSVFTGDANGVIIRWDVPQRRALARAVHGAPIRRARRLTRRPPRRVGGAGGGARLARRRWQARHPAAASLLSRGVSFNASGAQLLTVARDARLYDTRAWARAPIVLDQPGLILTAVFSSAGDRVATGGRDDLAVIWTPGTEHASTRSPTAATSRRRLVPEWSPACHGQRGQRRPGLPHRHRRARHVPGRASNQVVARVQPGRHVDRDGLARRVRAHLGRGRLRTLGRATRTFGRSARRDVHADGKSVVTASDDGSARVWKPAVDPILSLVGRHTAAGRAVAVASGW